MNHVVLFVYVVLITAGTGGVVSLSFLHYRLRTGITRAFLVSNSALLASLLLSLISFYLDAVAPGSPSTQPFSLSAFRTLFGFVLGVVTYGGVATALFLLPRAKRPLIAVTYGVSIAAMLVQTVLILGDNVTQALRLAPAYMYTVSACLLVLGIISIRSGRNAPTPTMAWFLVRFGYLTTIFAVASTAFYTAVYRVPVLQEMSFSLDFVYYLLWSILSILAFIRYLTRPAAFLDSDEPSASFIAAYGVTRRECDVITLISQGLSNQEIADRLGVSFATVRTHVYNIFQKTGAGSRVDLLRLAGGFRE